MDGAIKDVLNGPHEYKDGHYVAKEVAVEPAVEPTKDENPDEA